MEFLGSHNSWTYLRPRRWWMRLIRFAARCQRVSVREQYEDYGVRCFDLRVRFDHGEMVMAHGVVEYRYALAQLLQDLRWMNTEGDCLVRVVHEVRTRSQQSESSAVAFRDFCSMLEATYPAVSFWCGRNLADWQVDYQFMNTDPSCEELYASVCPPRFDDIWPWLFAWLNNSYIRLQGTDKEVLLIDFVDIE